MFHCSVYSGGKYKELSSVACQLERCDLHIQKVWEVHPFLSLDCKSTACINWEVCFFNSSSNARGSRQASWGF